MHVALADSTFWLIHEIAESATLWLIQIWLIQKIAESGIFWLIQIWLIQKIAKSAIFWLIQIWVIQGNSWMSQILANSADSGLIWKFLAHSGFTDIPRVAATLRFCASVTPLLVFFKHNCTKDHNLGREEESREEEEGCLEGRGWWMSGRFWMIGWVGRLFFIKPSDTKKLGALWLYNTSVVIAQYRLCALCKNDKKVTRQISYRDTKFSTKFY